MEIIRSATCTSLNQRKYILDILNSAELVGCKSVSTPFPTGITLSKKSAALYSDLEQYRRLVGQLLYLIVVVTVNNKLPYILGKRLWV